MPDTKCLAVAPTDASGGPLKTSLLMETSHPIQRAHTNVVSGDFMPHQPVKNIRVGLIQQMRQIAPRVVTQLFRHGIDVGTQLDIQLQHAASAMKADTTFFVFGERGSGQDFISS